MTRRNPLEELEHAHTNREIGCALDRAPNLVSKRSGGNHLVWVGPRGSVAAPMHPGDCCKGTKRAIIRQAIAAGLFCLAALLGVFVLAQAVIV